ncbi:MAG: cell division septum initiation protein DivIVA [Candidatus Azotimanducaceae bacterium]|jgi:cell division septum initiation protein DivIVA
MSNINEVAELLEHKLDKLLDVHSFLKDENEFLHKKLNSLEIELTHTSQELVEKEKEYQLLKIAKTIEGSNKNTRETKLKINALIRDIDKCIVQLND